MDPSSQALAAVQRAFRSEYGRTVAVLMRSLGDLDAAEDAVQEAFAVAASTWPQRGVPPNPQAWLVTTARNRAIDRLRRASTERRHLADLVIEPVVGGDDSSLDDELRMILLCAHPALSAETQVALMLRFVGGLTTAEIARAFGSSESTVGQRLSRAKAKIRDARIGLPEPGAVHERLDVVLAVIYGIHNEGYVTTAGPLSRVDLCQEAVRLARIVVAQAPGEPEAVGLLALLLLVQARRFSRVDAEGGLVTLPDQDRRLWDHAMIDEGHALVRQCLAVNQPGPYQVQAAIQAVHCDAASDAEVDWSQILALYDQLLVYLPTPAVRTARMVAVSRVEGVEVALAQSDPAAADHYALAVRGDLLERLGRGDEARQAFLRAAAATQNVAERAHLQRRADQCVSRGEGPNEGPAPSGNATR